MSITTVNDSGKMEFSFENTSRGADIDKLKGDSMPYKDEAKRKAASRQTAKNYYLRNKSCVAQKTKQHQEKLNEIRTVVKLKYRCLFPKCKWQGDFDPCMLDFHHIDKEAKLFNIGSASCSVGTMLKEICKCTVICANCHRMITSKQIDVSDLPICDFAEMIQLIEINMVNTNPFKEITPYTRSEENGKRIS